MPHETQSLLILGGARSGKSSRAQAIAEASGKKPVFIATAEARDAEMKARIARHAADRNASWRTVEESLAIVDAIRAHCDEQHVVVVDCLTLWLSNIMHDELEIDVESARLAACVATINTPLILVSNEVGSGIVPESELARRFRDAQGQLNKLVAAACRQVELVVAGLPLQIKG